VSGLASGYELDGSGLESRWVPRLFSALVKRWSPTPPSTEVKNELYLHSRSVPAHRYSAGVEI